MQAGFAGWGALAFIAFATLSPAELRPRVGDQHLEQLLAFAAMTGLLGLAYPRRLPLVLLLAVLAAVGLEASQLVIPGRHGRLFDLLVKMSGAGVGALAAAGVNAALARVKLRLAARG